MALALIGIGALIIGIVVVLSIVWRRPGQPSADPGTSGPPNEGGQTVGLWPPADDWANAERPRRDDAEGLKTALTVGLFATLPVTAFTYMETCFSLGPSDCTEAEQIAIKVQLFGMPGCAVIGLLGALVVEYQDRPVWLKACLVGQALAALIGIVMALPRFGSA